MEVAKRTKFELSAITPAMNKVRQWNATRWSFDSITSFGERASFGGIAEEGGPIQNQMAQQDSSTRHMSVFMLNHWRYR